MPRSLNRNRLPLVKKVFRSPAFFLLVIVVAGAAFATKDQWDWLFADSDAQTVGAFAPALEDLDGDTEHLYRMVTDDGSSLTYTVEENLAGNDGTASGTTTAVAGEYDLRFELALNRLESVGVEAANRF